MIETLSLRNFKALREVRVRLRPLTLIVGPNASGKSSLLQALSHLTEFPSRSKPAMREFFQGARAQELIMSHVSDNSLVMGCTGQFAGNGLVLGLTLENGRATARGQWGGSLFDIENFPEGLAKAMRPAVVMSLEFKRMASPSFLKETDQTLPSNGEGLSTILADLYLEHRGRYQDLLDRLKEVIPSVQDLRVRRTPEGFELLFDMLGAKDIPASSVSEGTLLTLGLLTLLAHPNPPQLVLIDDLERGLHPRAMGSLINQFHLLQQQNPELQIVATTHSPYLLDYVKADEVLLTSLGDDGYAAVKPLTEHPDYERWKDVMAPGEFWSTVGERWVTEQPHK